MMMTNKVYPYALFSLVPSHFLHLRERVWGTVHIRRVPVEYMIYARH